MTVFTDKAPWVMNLLKADFDLTTEEAAAILGNLGHECAGFTDLVESDPNVGGKGGFGWAQWTGQTASNPRRKNFEAYCARNKLDRYSDKANYGFLFVEMKGPEKRAIPALKAATGLYGKVQAFEKSFERAGVKNYTSRNRYADMAMAAWRANPTAKPPPEFQQPDDPGPAPDPDPDPGPVTPPPKPKKGFAGADSLSATPKGETTMMEAINGRKTYIALGIGGVVVILNALGFQIPGVNLDPNDWFAQIMAILTAGGFRSAMNKKPE